MVERIFDRAFNKVLFDKKRAEEGFEAERPRSKSELEAREADRIRREAAPMTTSDAIKRMLLAYKDKDYFRLLELPAPHLDALGRPAWNCTSSDVSKAYRKLSALVHPDKNPAPDARAAFEALNKAHRALREPGSLGDILNKHVDSAKRRQEAAEAAASPDERAILYAEKKSQAQQLKNNEAKKYMEEVLQQRQRLQERAKRKQEIEKRAKRQLESSEISDEEPELEVRKRPKDIATAKRKGKPNLIF